jgi:hypothetical protein
VWKCIFTGRADFFFWLVITTFNILWGLFRAYFLFSLLQLGFDQSAKGDLVITMTNMINPQKGIDLINNKYILSLFTKGDKNILCSYTIF